MCFYVFGTGIIARAFEKIVYKCFCKDTMDIVILLIISLPIGKAVTVWMICPQFKILYMVI